MEGYVVIIVWAILLVLITPLLRAIILRHKVNGESVPLSAPYKVTDLKRGVENLAKAVSFATVSYQEWEKTDLEVFRGFREFLKESYPLTFSKLTVLDAGELNILLYWEGENTTLLPALLMAHQDVVDAQDAKEWTYPPFASTVEQGYVWGRGSFDAKAQLIAIMESLEMLLAAHKRPQRSYYIAFGCDEEIRGSNGAQKIAQFFVAQNIRFAFVLDEGGVVADAFISALKEPVAVVGVAEKSNTNIVMTLAKEGGHSSNPQNPSAVALLSRAIWRLEKRKFKGELTQPIRELLTILGLNAPFLLSIPLLNLWLFKPLVAAIFSKNPATDALLRSTCAVTMVKGSSAANVIANKSEAVANVRLLPNRNQEVALKMVKRRVKNRAINYQLVQHAPPSRISSTESAEFSLIKETINRVFPEALVSPYLMAGGTDAIWFEALCDNVFRFTPALMDSGELKRMHGKNERFSLANLERAISFYATLITQGSHH